MRRTLFVPTFAIAVAIAGVFGALAATAPAHADGATTSRWSIDFAGSVNECTGEVLQGTLHVHMVFREAADGSGGLHGHISSNSHGSATSNLGVRYRIQSSYLEKFTLTSDFSKYGVTALLRSTLKGQGPSNNYVMTSALHVREVDGVFKVESYVVKVECR
jgi:hypothetical protein